MILKKSSSRVEKETFFNEVARKAKRKGFEREAFQSVLRVRKIIQNPPRKWHKMFSYKLYVGESPTQLPNGDNLENTYPLSP
jgi:hypothetical protein